MPESEENLPFGLSRARTFEADRTGGKRALGAGPPPFLSPRHKLVLGLFFLSLCLVGLLAGATVAAFVAGARGAAAVLALLTLAATPLTLLGPAQDWWRHRRGRRLR